MKTNPYREIIHFINRYYFPINPPYELLFDSAMECFLIKFKENTYQDLADFEDGFGLTGERLKMLLQELMLKLSQEKDFELFFDPAIGTDVIRLQSVKTIFRTF